MQLISAAPHPLPRLLESGADGRIETVIKRLQLGTTLAQRPGQLGKCDDVAPALCFRSDMLSELALNDEHALRAVIDQDAVHAPIPGTTHHGTRSSVLIF